MTKSEYIIWKASRGDDAAQWDHAICRSADLLVKEVALAKLATKFRGETTLQPFLLMMCRAHFGSIEVDQFLQDLDCYPDWI